jgi:hypothetical protein
MSKGLSDDAERCLEFIEENPGTRMVTLATLLGKPHSIYGKQKAATLAIAELRRKGLVVDCPRCPYCLRALSRARRNVPLFPMNGHKRPKQWDLFGDE